MNQLLLNFTQLTRQKQTNKQKHISYILLPPLYWQPMQASSKWTLLKLEQTLEREVNLAASEVEYTSYTAGWWSGSFEDKEEEDS